MQYEAQLPLTRHTADTYIITQEPRSVYASPKATRDDQAGMMKQMWAGLENPSDEKQFKASTMAQTT